MAAKKIMLFLVPVFILALSIILASSLFSLPSLTTKGIPGKQIQKVIQQIEFSQWRDETTDPGFNSAVNGGPRGLMVSTGQADFGKAMSGRQPIALTITRDLQLLAEINRLSPGGKATLRVMNANEPYEAFDVARIEKAGEYAANLHELTRWQGDTNLWLELWLEGKNKSVAVGSISFLTLEKTPVQAQPSLKKKAGWLAGLQGKRYVYQKEFSEGADGWRNGQTDPGFNTIFELAGGLPRFKLQPGFRNGKILSPAHGIQANVTSKTEFMVDVQDPGGLRAKIDLMETTPPYATKTILDWISQPGTYKAKLAQKTSWKGQKRFWIQIWLEPTSNPVENASGVVIKRIQIKE